MSGHDRLVRIFWPAGRLHDNVWGTLVGWRNSDTDILVASVMPETEPRNVDNALRMGALFRESPYPVHDILTKCGPAGIQVLGTLNPPDNFTKAGTHQIRAYTDSTSSLARVQTGLGYQENVQVIVYARPRPDHMQFMSLDPISLALTDGDLTRKTLFDESIDAAERQDKSKRKQLVEKLKLHTVHDYPSSQKEVILPTIINQINCSLEIDTLLQKNIGLVRRRSRRTPSVSERVVETATGIWDYTRASAYQYIWPMMTQTFILILMLHRIAAEAILLALSWRHRTHHAALKDVSATAQQIDLRLQQFCYWPIQFTTLQRRKNNWGSITKCHSEYIRFYNSLWLVANDVIIGIAVGSYIIDNASAVASLTDQVLETWSLDGLKRMISWLMVYPAGLKLNNELAVFLGDLFLWVIDYWAGCVALLQPYFPLVIRFMGFASFAGATMPLSMLSDVLSFLTLHIHCFYIASARIYSWQLTIIISLFHLFRGKKRNVLRNRIDSCDYELDQLLLGTILFTLLFFLLPTVLVFYFTFATARMAIIFFKAILDTLLACLNHFPLFALMLRIKDPWRLPGGIRFELLRTPDVGAGAGAVPEVSTSFITLKSIPLELRAMFHEYAQLGGRIRKHYFSPRVFLRLATGHFVPPLHRKNLYGLQYSMLPPVRVAIPELWRTLHPLPDTASGPAGTSHNSSSGGGSNSSSSSQGAAARSKALATNNTARSSRP